MSEYEWVVFESVHFNICEFVGITYEIVHYCTIMYTVKVYKHVIVR